MQQTRVVISPSLRLLRQECTDERCGRDSGAVSSQPPAASEQARRGEIASLRPVQPLSSPLRGTAMSPFERAGVVSAWRDQSRPALGGKAHSAASPTVANDCRNATMPDGGTGFEHAHLCHICRSQGAAAKVIVALFDHALELR